MDQRVEPPLSVVIVGGGFAGAALAVRLLDATRRRLAVTVVEPRAELGRGVAYSCREPVHLVNGHAGIFSLHPEDPGHLARWLAGEPDDPGWTSPGGDPADWFIPRARYGAYVGAELARAVAGARGRSELRHLRTEATDVRRRDGRLVVLTGGGDVPADVVVLATGVFPLAADAAIAGHRRYAASPWDGAALDRVAEGAEVLLIGASLSMVDAVASLEARGFRGRYRAISRRGHLIEPRRTPDPWRDFLGDGPLPRSARALLAAVIRERRAILAAGGDWQALPPAIRPHILPLWQEASNVERLRFVRHLRALWDVSVHRAAPASFAAVAAATAEGRFEAAAGRLRGLAARGDRIEAEIRWRRSGQVETVAFDSVVNCRGHQEHDWRRIDAPLVRNLLAGGLVRPHSTGFGIDAADEGRVIGGDGVPQPDLWAIGHPLRGVAWESSSIPEQVEQASALAERIERLPARQPQHHDPRAEMIASPAA